MKTLKLFIAAFTVLFAVLISTANEYQENQQALFGTEFVTPNCDKTSAENEKTTCTPEIMPIVPDYEMREDYNALQQEEDTPFEFDSLNYLPENFNAYDEDEYVLTQYGLLNTEADVVFEFDTSNYLPEDFNAYDQDEYILTQHELLNTEADAPFEFDTSDYLPVAFYVSK